MARTISGPVLSKWIQAPFSWGKKTEQGRFLAVSEFAGFRPGCFSPAFFVFWGRRHTGEAVMSKSGKETMLSLY